MDAQVGAKLAGVVMGSITGVDPYDVVMSSLNGSQGSDFADFAAGVNAKLSQIEDELDNVADAVQALSNKANQIQISLTDAKLQTVLGQYENDASVVNQAYMALNSALTALQSTNPDDRKKGAQLIVDITSEQQISHVESAMLDICTSLNGDGVFRGILAYMPDLLDASVRGLGQNNVSAQFATVCGRPAYDSFWLMTQFYPQYTATITNSITPLFESVLGVLQKGITLLELAYVGTIQQGQLTQHYASIVTICKYIDGFWSQVTDTTTLGNAMTAVFNDIGKTNIDVRLRQMCWAHWNVITPDPNDDGGVANYPFPGNYAGLVTVKPTKNSCPPGFNIPASYVSSIPPNLTFGGSVMQLMFEDAGDYVQFGMAFGFGAGTMVHYPIPTVSQFFGTKGAPSVLADTTTLLEAAQLLTPQVLPTAPTLTIEEVPRVKDAPTVKATGPRPN